MKLHSRKYGTGPEVLILFHGFGQNSSVFETLIPALKNTCTIHTIDLYYHGSSQRQDKPLTKKEWVTDFRNFLDENRIGVCTLAGFSLGGRFALATALGLPARVKKVILMAPDGIYQGFWYRLATSPLGNPLFKYLMLNPARFHRWLHFFERYSLASSAMIRFAKKELQDAENCLKVYRSWTYFRPLQHSCAEIIHRFNATEIPLHVILGEKDSVIPVRHILPKIRGIKMLKSHILPFKHHHLVAASEDLIPSLLLDEKL